MVAYIHHSLSLIHPCECTAMIPECSHTHWQEVSVVFEDPAYVCSACWTERTGRLHTHLQTLSASDRRLIGSQFGMAWCMLPDKLARHLTWVQGTVQAANCSKASSRTKCTEDVQITLQALLHGTTNMS